MKKTLLISLLIISTLAFSQTNSITDDNWNNGPTWDSSVVPPDNGDTVFITSGTEVDININTTYGTTLIIVVRGVLVLDATLSLPSGSQIVIEPGGEVTSGNNGWRLEIGAATWKDFKKDPHTGGILTDIVLSLETLDFSSELQNEQDIKFKWIIELDNDDLKQIEIQSSLDGKSYSTFHEVDASQNEGEIIINGGSETYVTYFKMKVTDEKHITYSDVQKVVNENYKMKIYPNPFKDEINMISFSALENVHVSIIDILGKEIFRSSQFSSTINTSELSEGIYFINIFQNEVLMQRQRMLKK